MPGAHARGGRGHRTTAAEREYVAGQRARAIIGGPRRVRQELETMARRYGADEVMVLTITGDYASRTQSYERLIGLF
jgi:alkanesulfonate monooxygenase SsuD/methylene tetrahydromethanopterin reductase-like flavin-dependent oxidoreductase (luciferase family)